MTYSNPQYVVKTNSNAILGFVLSLASVFTVGVLLAIPGLLVSRTAQREIASTGEAGGELAKWGVWISWCMIIGTAIGAVIGVILVIIAVIAGLTHGTGR